MTDEREGLSRARQMAQRVAAEAERFGVTPPEVSTVVLAHDTAMRLRERELSDEYDSRYLHPGRSVLVLLEDAGVRDGTALAAAALVESEFPHLEVKSEAVKSAVGAKIAELRDAVPVPARAGLGLQRLLAAADPGVRLIALCERLDQLRHAHLWPETERRMAAHTTATEIYLPVAEQTHERLAQRYRWWCRMFARRFLGRRDAGSNQSKSRWRNDDAT